MLEIQPYSNGTCSRGCEHFTPLGERGYCLLRNESVRISTSHGTREICPIAHGILVDVARAGRRLGIMVMIPGHSLKNLRPVGTGMVRIAERMTWVDWEASNE